MKNATLAQLFPGNPGKLTPWIFPDSKELAALHEANAAQEGKTGKQPVPLTLSRWCLGIHRFHQIHIGGDLRIPWNPQEIRSGSIWSIWKFMELKRVWRWPSIKKVHVDTWETWQYTRLACSPRYQWNQDLFGIPGPLVFFHWWVGNLDFLLYMVVPSIQTNCL